VNKAWNYDGADGEQEIPPSLRKRLTPKHTMRRHHLGKPKTAKSRRTVEYGEVVSDALRRLTRGRANDDFVFVTQARSTSTALRWAGGLPWYQSDFYEGRWVPALAAAHAAGLPKAPRFHDLRHTYVAWAVASGASGGVVSGWLDGRENAFSTPGHRALHGHVSAMAPVLGRPSLVRRRQW